MNWVVLRGYIMKQVIEVAHELAFMKKGCLLKSMEIKNVWLKLVAGDRWCSVISTNVEPSIMLEVV